MAISSARKAFQRTPFVAREAELGDFRRLLAETAAGSGAIVMVGGQPGIGKSRLTEEVTAAARVAGFATLTGHCYEGNAASAYSPLVEALQGSPGAEPLADQLIAAGLSASNGDLAAEHERHSLWNSVAERLSSSSQERPLLLVIEDLHWAPAPSVLLLRSLLSLVSRCQLLIVGTYRTGDEALGSPIERPATLTALLQDVRRAERGFLMDVHSMSERDVGTMVESVAGEGCPPALLRAIFEQTEGNPLFIEEVVKHLIEEGRLIDENGRWAAYATTDDLQVPASLRPVIERRLERISEACRRALTAAAVIGRMFDFEVLAAVTGEDPDPLLDSLDEATRARLLSSGEGDLLQFSHELIRQTLLLQVSAPRRQRLHLKVIQALEAVHEDDIDAASAELAHHSMRAGGAADRETTIRYVSRAAERAIAATAYEESARLYRYALPLVPFEDKARRLELTLRLGTAEKRMSDSDEARHIFIDAAELARELEDAESLARAALGHARSWATVGSVDEPGVALLREAEQELGDKPTGLRAQILARLAGQLMYTVDQAEVLRLSKDAVQTARQAGDSIALARALQTHHVTLWQPDHLDERMEATAEMMDVAQREGIAEIALWSHRPRIADLTALGEIELAEAELETYVALADSFRQPVYIWQAAVRRAMLATYLGRLREAERLATEAFGVGQRAGGQNLTAAFGQQMLIIRWLQGRLTEIEPLAVASHKAQPATAVWRAVLAFIYAETGRETEARRELEYLTADGLARLGNDDTGLISAVLLSVIAARIGHAGASG